MPEIRSMKDLEKFINSAVQDVMKNQVGEVVKETMQKHIQSDVYDVYEPKSYQRMEYNGGLIADENIEVRDIKDGIEVENITTHDGKYIPAVIETGQGYTYEGYGYEYEAERPFLQNTREDLRENKQHIEALKDGLSKKGVKIE